MLPEHNYFFRTTAVFAFILVFLATACQQTSNNSIQKSSTLTVSEEDLDTAIFAGGCFWCTESDFDKVPGVISTTSGFIGGTVDNPTYKQVVTGNTGHVEAVRIEFDKTVTSYAELLEAFWPTIDPVFEDGQFCDIGPQYRSAIFYLNPEQQTIAEASKAALEASGRFTQPVVTEILPATQFYAAEEYHQDYYLKNPLRYSYYRNNCGRDDRLQQIWKNGY
ncbi:peptide-methionine (S)-S-oxide reductase [Nitrosomonas sp. Nm51]|uniref:peptide-methionine (S)-S-oxide reductase MsrA n=1 Tax=Nitrosomonas sp. Nm51 TaxID=133720 RepID=UPI0008B89C74|nr:peptide-methionine (S)-S-oxide reductase MsrA [Nitrosomonas sp. Nm51]SER36302.1 peptide-methionine (S)-S-oxide reductase [Nitrosomonas sp. Nm51]